MALFTDEDIQGFADLGEELALKDDCEILEDIEQALDSMGGALHTWLPRPDLTQWPVSETVKSAVLDNVNPPSHEYMVANQIVGMVVKKVFLPLGTIIEKSWHLRIKGITYRIIEAIPDATYSVFTEVVVVVTTLGQSNG
jgi:hypothetical protein